MKNTLFLLALMVWMGGCSSSIPSPQERKATLVALGAQHHLTLTPIHTSPFTLMSMVSSECTTKTMRMYIEGDGLSWVTRSRLSQDPTPITPLAAKLMLLDPSGCKAYLARPCQYTLDAQCTNDYWSSRRFSPEVIESYSQALDGLKERYALHSFTVIGYSGGGAVAALVAASRTDVTQLITVAGNVDTQTWVELHNLDPLEGSLNPADAANRLETIEQFHLIGKEDTIVPPEVFFAYRNRFNHPQKIHYHLYDHVTHKEGWEEPWSRFLSTLP